MLAAATALRDGAILAVKGIGGFHLACRADDEAAVSALRARKHREDKPFALMVASVDDAACLVELGEAERALLEAPQRPIVLAGRRDGGAAEDFSGPTTEKSPRVAQSVAPGAPELGVMLPYSPLHHLLLTDVGSTLVMTSGNVSDEPIAYGDEDALARLAGIADMLLVHDRPIETRTDDSVVRAVAAGAPDGTATAAEFSADVHAPLARLRPREHSAAGPSGTPDTGLRRRAEEHLLRGEGVTRLGQSPHR